MLGIVFLLFLSAVSAQLEVAGPCNFANMSNYENPSSISLAGTWYQIERIPNSIETGECSRSVLRISREIAIEDTTTDVVTGYKYDSEVVDGKLVLRNGTITNMTDSGVFEITYDDAIQNYVVLGTDFTGYLVLYSCRDSGSRSIISAWKFGRNTTYSESAANTTRTLVENANLNGTTWKAVSHSAEACKVTGGGVNLRISPIILLIVGLALAK